MTIDLEQFVGKECVITLNNDRVFESVISKNAQEGQYPYDCWTADGRLLTYTKQGIYHLKTPNDDRSIKSIRLKKNPMTIDLSQFVDKEVIITLNSGKVIETTLRNQKNIQYPYWCVYYNAEGYATKQHFTKDGIYDFDYDPEIIYDGSHDIKSIRLKKPMTIDLEQFVGKECVITLRNGTKCQVHITDENSCYVACGEYLDDNFSYYCHFSKNGVNGPETTVSEFDIIHIEEIPKETPTKPMNSPELPESTIEKLAEVLSPDAVKYITGTEEYVTFMTEMLTEFVRERMGNLIEDVECEIVSTMVSDKIDLRVVK